MSKKEELQQEKEELLSETETGSEKTTDTTNPETQNETIENPDQNELKAEETDPKEEEITEEVLAEEIDPLEEANLKLATLNDKYVRLSAEFDNYRKRTLKEKMDMMKTAGADLIVDILPVMDNFERAIASVETSKDIEAVKEGILLIYNRFTEFLAQKGVKEIEAKEKELDTDLHEAITKIPAPTPELKGKIVDVIEKGYTLGDKVIRFSKVVIGE